MSTISPPFKYRDQAEKDLDDVADLRDQVHALFVHTAGQVAEHRGDSPRELDALDDLLAAYRRLASAFARLTEERAHDLWMTAELEAAR